MYPKFYNVTALFLVVALLLQGCSLFGGVKVETLTDGIAVSAASLEGAYDQVTEDLNFGRIDVQTAEDRQAVLDEVGVLLTLARDSVALGNPQAAEDYLAAANTILLEIERRLRNE